jgi:hypothetical protein
MVFCTYCRRHGHDLAVCRNYAALALGIGIALKAVTPRGAAPNPRVSTKPYQGAKEFTNLASLLTSYLIKQDSKKRARRAKRGTQKAKLRRKSSFNFMRIEIHMNVLTCWARQAKVARARYPCRG